jgi:hypothetical protein
MFGSGDGCAVEMNALQVVSLDLFLQNVHLDDEFSVNSNGPRPQTAIVPTTRHDPRQTYERDHLVFDREVAFKLYPRTLANTEETSR